MLDLGEIRRLILRAIYQSDFLSELMILKGGTALQLYGITQRASFDIDFSLFKLPDYDGFEEELKVEVENALRQVFEIEENFRIFSFKFTPRPRNPRKSQDRNWGGYRVEFKIIPMETWEELYILYDEERLNKALHGEYQNLLGTSSPLRIDISKTEHIETIHEEEIDEITVRIYTPEMLLFEKLRAICQQMEEYKERTNKTPRARDLFDIYLLDKKYNILKDFSKNIEKQNLIKGIFKAKDVDIKLLEYLENYREFHREDWPSLLATLPSEEASIYPRDFDYYFDYLLDIAKLILKTFNIS
jgi:predicted nucleotidyltransferase component of viral defense system